MADPAFVFKVQTRDVDGTAPARTYKRFENARKQFEEMLGRTMESAIEEMLWREVDAGRELPKADALNQIRAVSDYGTVIRYWKQEIHA